MTTVSEKIVESNKIRNEIRITNLDTLEVEKPFEFTGNERIMPSAISPDGKRFAVVAYVFDTPESALPTAPKEEKPSAAKLYAYDIESEKELYSISPPEENQIFVIDFKYSPDGAILALSINKNIYLLDAGSGKIVHTISYPQAARLAFSPDGTILASAHGLGGVQLWGVDQ